MSSVLRMTLRILGIAVGALFAVFGPLGVWIDSRLGLLGIASALGIIFTGAAFIQYGLTGASRGPRLPISVRLALGIILGAIALALGAYILLNRGSNGLATVALCAGYIISGTGLLIGAFVQWKASWPPNKSLDGAPGG